MPSAIMSLLVSHILTFVENEVIKNEPEIMDMIMTEIKSMIAKLEDLMKAKFTETKQEPNTVLAGRG